MFGTREPYRGTLWMLFINKQANAHRQLWLCALFLNWLLTMSFDNDIMIMAFGIGVCYQQTHCHKKKLLQKETLP